MPSTGYLQVHAYTANAQIPLEDTAIGITDQEQRTIALRLTNRSGQLDAPVAISVPNADAGLTPGSPVKPYTTVSLYAKHPRYEEIEALNVQIFPNTVTIQNLEMIPLSELPEYWNQVEIFDTPPQNL